MMNMTWRDHVASTPTVLRDKPRIKGTRTPVSLILGCLAVRHGSERIIGEFPDLDRAPIAACRDYARAWSEVESTD